MELGYQRILFFNGKQKLYFYDHESGKLTRKPGISQNSEIMSASETLSFGQADDLEMVDIMDRCMKDDSIKTAVVFTDGLDFINHTEHVAVRQMAAMVIYT